MPRESELDFDSWLDNAGVVFSTQLTGEQKLKFLRHVLGLCSTVEIQEISNGLQEHLLYGDFLTLLPAELSHLLLSYLDVKTLLIGCQVCRSWNDQISGNRFLWRKRALQWGFRLPEEPHEDALFYKQLFTTQNSLVNWWKQSCDVASLEGHTSVMAVYYHNGRIATGYDDETVRIWDAQTGHCLTTLTTHDVCSIKFDDSFFVTASYDCTAASWDARTGEQLRCYAGHIENVSSVDFDARLDILATGSNDGILKLWSLSKGDLLRTLERLDDYKGECGVTISNVRLLSSGDRCDRFNVLAGCDISLFCYGMDVAGMAVRTSQILFDRLTPHWRLVGWEVIGSSLTIVTVKCLKSQATHEIKETSYECSESDAAGGSFVVGKSSIFPLSKPVCHYEYLGSGKCFSAFASVSTKDNDPTLYIARRTGEIPLIKIDLQSVFSPTGGEFEVPDCSKFRLYVTLCNREWMDGISSDIFGKTILAAVFTDNSTRTLKFHSKEKRLS